MSLKGIAKETLSIVKNGAYLSPSGREVEIRNQIEDAVNGTVLYRPDYDFRLPLQCNFALETRRLEAAGLVIEVSNEKTTESALRLIHEGRTGLVLLNFASAKNPGGGFLGGAKAQEEDLARCSALYACLLTQPDYYEANRAAPSLFYTDHIIYSPDVPFFRDDSLRLLDEPVTFSVITAPAPNAGEILRKDPSDAAFIPQILGQRAARVLAVAELHGHENLVLGAWGCGVFRNSPELVAGTFASLLRSARFCNSFKSVNFAVFDRSSAQSTLRAFQDSFAS